MQMRYQELIGQNPFLQVIHVYLNAKHNYHTNYSETEKKNLKNCFIVGFQAKINRHKNKANKSAPVESARLENALQFFSFFDIAQIVQAVQ